MNANRFQLMIAGALIAALSACAGPSQLSVKDMAVAPPSLMVAQKSPRTAYIMLDPAKVPAQVPVLVDGENRGGKLVDVQTFVNRDLTRALGAYFADVKVVAPGQPLPAEPHAVVDVKLDRVEVVVTSKVINRSVEVSAGSAVLTWGLGLRMSESPDYLFSYAAESAGTPGDEPGFVFRSMFEAGITDFLHEYTEKHVQELVLAPAAASKG